MSSKHNQPERVVRGHKTTASKTAPVVDTGRPSDLASADEFLDLATLREKEPEPSRSDPAEVAAVIQLEWAMVCQAVTADELKSPGTVCVVEVPAGEWAEPICEAWTSLVSGRGDTKRIERFSSFTHARPITVVFLRGKAPDKFERERDADTVAEAMWRGYCTVGFSPEPGWLPPDLVAAADHRLRISPLHVEAASELARRLTGTEPSLTLMTAEAAAAGPRLLRLACRPDQTANQYLRKLRKLVQATDAAQPQIIKAPPGIVADGITLDQLAGMEEAVAWGRSLKDDLFAYRQKRRSWADCDRGVLVSGPTGCGKTTYARALARTCDVPLVQGSWSMWLANGTGHQGDFMLAMKKTFIEAREHKPCILFLDEIDSFPNRATLNHSQADWDIQCVNGLLAELDGVQGREGVVVVAACNHPHLLDPALTRSGRLDRHLRIGLPDVGALERIMRVHLQGELADVDLRGAALLALDSSGADVERLVRGARRRARNAERQMELTDLLAEIGGADDRTPEELERCAVHEAGHAVVSVELGRPITAVSVRSTDRQGGALHVGQKAFFTTSHAIHDELVFVLAGRAAEQVVLGEPSSGAGGSDSSDLALATRTAVHASCELGFDEQKGLLWHAMPDNGPALSAALRSDTALARRVRARLNEAYQDALTIIDRRRSAVIAVSTVLLAQGVLDEDGVAEIIRVDGQEIPR